MSDTVTRCSAPVVVYQRQTRLRKKSGRIGGCLEVSGVASWKKPGSVPLQINKPIRNRRGTLLRTDEKAFGAAVRLPAVAPAGHPVGRVAVAQVVARRAARTFERFGRYERFWQNLPQRRQQHSKWRRCGPLAIRPDEGLERIASPWPVVIRAT